MSTITSSSTLAQVYEACTYSLSSSQKEVLQNVTVSTGQIMAVGLAGFDLTDLYTYCATASSSCTASNYLTYDGYALVTYVFDSSANTETNFGVCFNEGADTTCVTMENSGPDYDYNTLKLSANATASSPSSMTADAYATTDCTSRATGGFDSVCFGFNQCTKTNYYCTAYRFEQVTDTSRLASGTDIDVVSINTASVAAGTNTVTSLTLTGATTLAASSIVAAAYAILF